MSNLKLRFYGMAVEKIRCFVADRPLCFFAVCWISILIPHILRNYKIFNLVIYPAGIYFASHRLCWAAGAECLYADVVPVPVIEFASGSCPRFTFVFLVYIWHQVFCACPQVFRYASMLGGCLFSWAGLCVELSHCFPLSWWSGSL
jgi:hypothetical protein